MTVTLLSDILWPEGGPPICGAAGAVRRDSLNSEHPSLVIMR